MSRLASRASLALPALRYDVESPRDVEVRSTARLGQLEDRLTQQERTTHGLVEHAFRVKDDVIASLSTVRGSWQSESHARELLQEHIRTITDVVRRLNRDIQVSH
jgi:hypothetical protein